MINKWALAILIGCTFHCMAWSQAPVRSVAKLPIKFTAEDLVVLLARKPSENVRPGIDFDLREPVQIQEAIQFTFETSDPRVVQLVDQFVSDLSRINSGADVPTNPLSPTPTGLQSSNQSFETPPTRDLGRGSFSDFGDQKFGGAGTGGMLSQADRAETGSSGRPFSIPGSANNDRNIARDQDSRRTIGPESLGGNFGTGLKPVDEGQKVAEDRKNWGFGNERQREIAQSNPESNRGGNFQMAPPDRFSTPPGGGMATVSSTATGNVQTLSQAEIDRLVEQEFLRRYGSLPTRSKTESQIPSVGAGFTAEIPGKQPIVGQGASSLVNGEVNRQVTFLWFLLLFSIALNFYLGFLARSFYARYQDLADELRETFTSSSAT